MLEKHFLRKKIPYVIIYLSKLYFSILFNQDDKTHPIHPDFMHFFVFMNMASLFS